MVDNCNLEISIGIPSIDKEHLCLLSKISDIINGKGLVRFNPLGAFKHLIAIARDHFAHEEQIMILKDYPGLADHIQRHSAYIMELEYAVARLEAGDSMIYINKLSFYKNWLIGHITTQDRAFGQFLLHRQSEMALPPNDE